MVEEEEVNKIARQVANHLSGRPVKISWEQPPCKRTDKGWRAMGQCVKHADGSVTLYVWDAYNVQSKFSTLLHECAHARLDYDWIPDETAVSQPRVKTWESPAREERAEYLAKVWEDYAEKYAHKFYGGGRTHTHCKLLALLNCPQTITFSLLAELKKIHPEF